jgi:excisionase family DNA binding protein
MGGNVAKPEDNKILTADDLADELMFSRQTVIRMARAGELPMFKVRNRWLMTSETFDSWKRAREVGLTIGRSA